MAYKEYSTVNASEGIQVLFVYVNDVTSGLFSKMFLFALFIVTLLGSYFSSKRLSGQGDIWVSFAVAGYFVVGATLLMSLIPNLIDTFTVVITIVIAIAGTLALYLNKSAE